ncbi:MAG: TonB-dependent receptor [Bryobacteraceae bacterium]|nr:TonB-dependent receptor [Bryobacteraceae bacterium]
MSAQTTAVIRGVVTDPAGASIPRAQIRLENAVTGFRAATASGDDGQFTITNIPFQTYQLTVTRDGFAPSVRTVSLRSTIPYVESIRMELLAATTNIEISAFDVVQLVNPEETGTRAELNQTAIEKMALPAGNRGIESVLVTFPGFQQNANGAIHPRGAHNQMTFVIDGMPISDQLTGAFANAVDASIVQTVELYTGNIPVEYGNKVAAVANITTKSGAGTGRLLTGSVQLGAAQFGTLEQTTQVAGENGKLGYSGSVHMLKTQRYLDQVSLDNLHNAGHSTRAFSRFDYTPNANNIFRLNILAGSSPFELANLRSQQALGMDQRQLMRDLSTALSWIRTINAQSTWETNLSYRVATAQLFGSPGDTPVTASQARRLGTFTVANRWNRIAGRHTFRAGFDFQRFSARENFDFGITDPTFNEATSDSYNPALLPYDLTRGGSLFIFGAQDAGRLYSGYGQDSFRLQRFQFSVGLRYDAYRFLARGIQWQPRVGVSYNLSETGTVLRASYNRLYQTPVNENLLLSNSPQAAALTPPAVREALGSAFVLIRPEQQNLYEVGVQQAVFGRLSVSGVFYHKQAWNQADNNNLFNTGIIFPISLARIRVNSVEGRLVFPEAYGFSGTLSLTHSRAISTPPFTGGLFLGNDAIAALTEGAFLIDHDQALGMHGILNYSARRGFYGTLSVRHDSGLVINPSDPMQVANDPDHSDLLPYIDLRSAPPRARPRTITGIVVGYERIMEGRRRFDISAQVSNLFNQTAVYNFQSIFVGTRVVQPRTAGLRLRWYF